MLDKTKFLVPEELTMSQLTAILRSDIPFEYNYSTMQFTCVCVCIMNLAHPIQLLVMSLSCDNVVLTRRPCVIMITLILVQAAYADQRCTDFLPDSES